MSKVVHNLKEHVENIINNYVKYNQLNGMANQIFKHNKEAGWWDQGVENRNVGEILALIHSEVSEALEAARKDKMDDHLPHRHGLEVELADAIIRILDLAGAHNLDISGAVAEKFEYNKQRADHKRDNRKKDGGKKF